MKALGTWPDVTLMKSYLDAGGKLLIAYYDEGYYADI